MKKFKGYCEVCKKELKKGEKLWEVNICEKCFLEPLKFQGCGNYVENDDIDCRQVMAEKYLRPERELPF